MSNPQAHYIQTLSRLLGRWLRRKSRKLPSHWLQAALTLLRLDLEPARPLLTSLYSSSPRGRKPWDPIRILRALLLMLLLGEKSITKWAKTLRATPRLARIAGFDPFHTPGVGTFYLFLDRLEDGPFQPSCPHRVLPSPLRKGKHLRHLASEKQARHLKAQQFLTQFDSITQELSARLQAQHDQPRPHDLLQRLEDLLLLCAVLPSAEKGLLGDTTHLLLSGDGSALPSAANPNGTPSCACRQQGIYRWDHPRFYTDPTANWGYNPYSDSYYFGHTLYQHVVSTQGHDLPLHVCLGPASESDCTLSLHSLDRFQKTLQEHGLNWPIDSAIYDSLHDARGIYEYLAHKGISPVIPRNPRNGVQPAPTGNAHRINDQGIPLCEAGLAMRRHAGDPKRHRIRFNCPVKRPTHQQGAHTWRAYPEECPHGALCQPHSRMGPLVYVNTADDPRLYPPIPRNSKTFHDLLKLRTGCERSHSAKKETFRLGYRPCRNAPHYLIRLYLASILEHAKAWLAEDKKLLGDDPVPLIHQLQQRLLPQQAP